MTAPEFSEPLQFLQRLSEEFPELLAATADKHFSKDPATADATIRRAVTKFDRGYEKLCDDALFAALELAGVKSTAAVGKLVDLTRYAVQKWQAEFGRIPAQHIAVLEEYVYRVNPEFRVNYPEECICQEEGLRWLSCDLHDDFVSAPPKYSLTIEASALVRFLLTEPGWRRVCTTALEIDGGSSLDDLEAVVERLIPRFRTHVSWLGAQPLRIDNATDLLPYYVEWKELVLLQAFVLSEGGIL